MLLIEITVGYMHQGSEKAEPPKASGRLSLSAGDFASELLFRASSGLAAQAPWHLQKPGCWGSLTANPLLMPKKYYRPNPGKNL
jgi:hypothetical protein